MPRDGTRTRARILDAAEQLILGRGYGGTAVDDVLDRAGVTKGAFFHHFPSKLDLARTILQRYVDVDLGHLHDTVRRADELTRDPLQRLLVFVGLYRELLLEGSGPDDGCLMATYTAERGLFEEDLLDPITHNFQEWHDQMARMLQAVAAVHPPRVPVDLDSLADTLVVLVEGGFVMSRVRQDPGAIAAQLDHLRTYLELLFAPDLIHVE